MKTNTAKSRMFTITNFFNIMTGGGDVARFDAKMSTAHKKLLEEAASLKGYKNLTEYVVTTMVNDATEVVEKYSQVIYSMRDRQRIMEILNEPTELSDSFLKASKKRSERLKDEVSDS